MPVCEHPIVARLPNNRMQASEGGLAGGITRDGRAPAAPDAERYAH